MSPEVEDVIVVMVVAVVLREELVPRSTPSRTSSGAWLSPRPRSPASESESDESPVKGTERIWLAL